MQNQHNIENDPHINTMAERKIAHDQIIRLRWILSELEQVLEPHQKQKLVEIEMASRTA